MLDVGLLLPYLGDHVPHEKIECCYSPVLLAALQAVDLNFRARPSLVEALGATIGRALRRNDAFALIHSHAPPQPPDLLHAVGLVAGGVVGFELCRHSLDK
jgi:hypothetical protein